MPLSAQGVQGVKSILDAVTSEGPAGSPGLAFYAVDRSGKTLVEHQAGNLGIDSKQPVDEDTIFWIASCTKLVTAVALLQLVEQGKIGLDDAEAVKKHAPEISKKQVYVDGVNGAEQQNPVTLRMLLAHTAGFGYSFFDPRLNVGGDGGLEGQKGDVNDILNARLVNQPGSMWEYGANLDWAGIILERITGQHLEEYFAEHIFGPLGIDSKGATIFPPTSVQSNLAGLHQRDPTSGELKAREHLYSEQLKQDTKEKQDAYFQSGGAALFAKPKEYIKILAAILNEGTSHTTGNRILSKASVDLLWENQIPNHPDFARGGPTPVDLTLVNPSPEFYPQPGNPPQGWTYGGFLTIEAGPTGRGANTIWWMGLPNCFWWIDRERGVAGFLAGQVLPNGDPKIIPTWFMCEKTIYDTLE